MLKTSSTAFRFSFKKEFDHARSVQKRKSTSLIIESSDEDSTSSDSKSSIPIRKKSSFANWNTTLTVTAFAICIR